MSIPPEQDWLDRIARLRSWSRGGSRAPHKALLLLLVFGQLQRTGSAEIRFREAEEPLRDLLSEFGPAGARPRPEYPFYHLQTDELWTLTPAIPAPRSGSPTRRRLLEAEVVGKLVPDFSRALNAQPWLLAAAARELLDANFPPEQHVAICEAVGLDLEALELGEAST